MCVNSSLPHAGYGVVPLMMANSSSRVCVLLSSFNGARFIEQQVSSIVTQVGVETVVFVRDDGSSDATNDIVRALAKADSRVQVVSDVEYGPTGLPTKAFLRLFALVDFSDFDFVALSDQDDIWLPDKLARATAALQSSGADGFSSDLLSFYEDGRFQKVRKSGPQKTLDYLFQGASAGCTYVLTSRFASEVGARLGSASALRHLPDRASHDWLIYALCRGVGGGWVMEAFPLVIYRQHRSNVYGAQAGFTGLLSRLKLARSGWLFSQSLFLETVLPESPIRQRVFTAIRRLSFLDRIWLALNSYQFRRETRDVVLLALFFLVSGRPK